MTFDGILGLLSSSSHLLFPLPKLNHLHIMNEVHQTLSSFAKSSFLLTTPSLPQKSDNLTPLVELSNPSTFDFLNFTTILPCGGGSFSFLVPIFLFPFSFLLSSLSLPFYLWTGRLVAIRDGSLFNEVLECLTPILYFFFSFLRLDNYLN